MYGKGLVSSSEINHHKAMAQGKTDGGSAQRVPASKQNMATATTGELSDSQRCCSVGGGSHGQQGAPDHGKAGGDHFRRGGML